MSGTDPAPADGGALRRPDAAAFDALYRAAPVAPAWDLGRPQSAFVALADAGALRGRVLDVGCGTGEHALLAAARGLDATGVDFALAAIERARAKARDRGLDVRFLVQDALDLAALGEQFDTVLDCGLFHVYEDASRRRYVESLAAITHPGSRYFLLCFSDRQPGILGPRRVKEGEIRAAFAGGWRVDSAEPARIDLPPQPDPSRPAFALAWLAAITRS